jgi:hypothetical protein
MCNVTSKCFDENMFAVKSNKYYIFVSVWVSAREDRRVRARVRVCGGGRVVGAQAQACACARVGLLIEYATRRRHVVCVLSGFTIFFDIIL